MEAAPAAENSKEDLENLKTELDEKEEEISGFRQREVCLVFGLSIFLPLFTRISDETKAIDR